MNDLAEIVFAIGTGGGFLAIGAAVLLYVLHEIRPSECDECDDIATEVDAAYRDGYTQGLKQGRDGITTIKEAESASLNL